MGDCVVTCETLKMVLKKVPQQGRRFSVGTTKIQTFFSYLHRITLRSIALVD